MKFESEDDIMLYAYNEYIEIFNKIVLYVKNTILKDFPLMNIYLIYTDNTYNGCNYLSYIVVNLRRIIHDAIKQDILQYKYTVENRLLYVVLHESFHQLQAIILPKYLHDRNYNRYIEGNCDYNVLMYLDTHKEELESILGIKLLKFCDVDTLYDNKVYFPINNNNLGFKLFTRLFSKLSDTLYVNQDIEMYYNIYYSFDNINIIYTNYNLEFNIKSDNIFNMDEYNSILYNNRYELVYCIINNINIDTIYNNTCNIMIEIADINRMCIRRINDENCI